MLQKIAHIISFFSLLLLVLWGKKAYAQDPVLSQDGYFAVDYVKGCAPLQVKVVEQNGEGNNRSYKYISESGGTVPWFSEKTFTFHIPDTYYIIQNINGADLSSGRFDTIRVDVLEPVLPEFEVNNCGNGQLVVQAAPGTYDYFILNGQAEQELNRANNFQFLLQDVPAGTTSVSLKGMYEGPGTFNNCGEASQQVVVRESLQAASLRGLQANLQDGSISITYDLLPNVDYQLEVQENGSGNFSSLGAPEPGGFTISGKDLESNFFCFRIRTLNPCAPNDPPLLSNTLCSAVLSGNATKKGNEISFKTGPNPAQSVVLLRDGQPLESFNNTTEGEYLDAAINCNTGYEYALQISDGNFKSLTEGLQLQSALEGELQPAENILSFWENNIPFFKVLPASLPQEAQYSAFQAGQESPELFSQSDKNVIKLVNRESSSCYLFTYSDDCGNTSALSREVCALYLYNNTSQPDVLAFEWNEYQGYEEGVSHYVLEEYDAQGNLINTYETAGQTHLDLGVQQPESSGNTYIVKAFPFNPSLELSSSNPYVFQLIMQGYFPNAFTPDGDQVNDYFKAEGKFVTGGSLEIFNRWGNTIFSTNDLLTGWNGTAGGRPAQPGTYFYKAQVTTEDGNQQIVQGSVLLLR